MPEPGYAYRKDWITALYVIQHTNDTVFIYGDNFKRVGLGGIAKIMRYRTNTIGITTKWLPNLTPEAYFTEEQWISHPEIKHEIDRGFKLVVKALHLGRNICIPTDGIGTGLAQLEAKAPSILSYINNKIQTLERLYPNPKGK